MFHMDLFLTPVLFYSFCSLYQYNVTPLIVAAQYGRTEVVVALLDRGANIEAKNKVSKYDVLLLAAAGIGYLYYIVVCEKLLYSSISLTHNK